MDDNRIEIVARLDTSRAAVVKIEADLSQIADQVNKDRAFKIIGNLDLPKTTQRIQSQLATINKNLKLNINAETSVDVGKAVANIQNQLSNAKTGNIEIGGGQSVQNIDKVSKSIDNVSNKVLTLKKTLADLDSRLVEPFEAINNLDGTINAERSMSVIQDKLSPLGTVTVTGKYNDQESADSINKIIARIEAASGEVRELNFLLDQTGKKFEYIGGSYSDRGVGKIQQDLARLSKELANFEASHKSIEGGLVEPLTAARNAIIDLEAGVGSVEAAQKALDNLKTVAANIGSNLKSTGSSFNVFDNAANKAQNFDNTIKTLKMDIDSLSPSGSKSSLVSQLDLAVERMSEFKRVEEESGRGLEWSQRYGEISSLLQAITNNLKVAQKEEASFNKEFEKALKEEEKQVALEQKRVEVARQLREEQQHDYWQGRFEETVKGMTAENAELKKMREYYEGINAAAKQAEKEQNQLFKEQKKAENFANRLKRMAADMKAYAAANERAVNSTKLMSNGKSFADEWNRLSQLASTAGLTDQQIKQLATDMAVFKKEASAAGLAGASAFERFANSFKVISTYISANQLVNMVIRNVRSAITELQTVDDILTEISKTSDRTEISLRKLGETSYDSASKYGRVASDYLLGIQEMSRAGFNETQSENLAKLSILAQAAGDMTAEMANEYIIATNAAYGLEGSEEKLNQILDSQNYITNHNALNMENLAQATKVAASQASASGVAIDELTAAVGTMVATTQQGGDVAGRAFKGILMNIQQVKASASDIGDGGEDITTESLSKYEAATKALGVSLTEVRNGVTQLREPMEVLKELSIAVRKESEGSIKVANLVSAVGGKFRGNQLIALLQNWDTYEKMLSEFNSNEAMGSAMQEAEKSANNWSGSLNKVKNSWDELVNSFIDSDNAVDVLQSVNTIIQNLTDSAATGSLKTLADMLTGIVGLVGDITNAVGTLPVLLTGIATVKGVSIFGEGGVKQIINEVKIAKGAINDYNGAVGKRVYAQKMFNEATEKSTKDVGLYLRSLNGADASLSGYGSSLVGAKIKTVALDVATKALDATITFGLSVAISLLVSQISKWINSQKEEEEAQEELRRQYKETAEEYRKNSQALDDVVERYAAIVSSTTDVISREKSLSALQDELIEKFGDKADAIDLVNQKYSEAIQKLQELKLAEAEDYIEEANRTGAYKTAKEALSKDYSYKWEDELSENRYVSNAADLRYLGKKIKGGLMPLGFSDVIKEAGVYDQTIFQGQGFYVTGTLEEQYEALTKIADLYSKQENYNEKLQTSINKRRDALREEIEGYKKLINEYEAFEKTISELNVSEETKQQFSELLDKAYEYNQIALGDGTAFEKAEAVQNLADLQEEMYNLVGQNQEYRTTIKEAFAEFVTGSQIAGDALQNIGAAWYETLDEMQKGAVSNIDKMKKAMQTLSEGGTLSASDFWALEQLDTSHILSNIEEVDGEFKVSLNSMQDLKDSYIQTQVTIVQGWIEAAKAAQEAQDAIIESNTRKLKEWKFSEKSLLDPKYRAEYERLEAGIATARDLSAQYGETIKKDELLIRQLNSSLGYTVDKQKQLTQLANDAQAKADDLLKAYEYRIDQIVDGFEEEKEAIEASRDALQDQLAVLEEQQKAIQETIDRYETAADVVAEAIQAQIDALKKQNEEREEALDLAEKLANLENAKNNKVRTYTEAGGWTYEAKKADVQKAQKELNKAQADEEIKTLEAYLKKWQNRSNKAQKAADERTTTEILGADWREKIAKQDEDIFKMYEEEYDKYNEELYQVSNVEMETLKKAIDAKNKDIAAKEAQIKEWQKYKSEVQKAASEAKAATEDWWKLVHEVALNESDDYDTRTAKLNTWYEEYAAALQNLTYYQKQLNEATGDFDSSDMQEQIDELVKTVEKLKWEDDDESEGHKAWLPIELVGSHSNGGVNSNTGLAMLHGTKQKAETIFNANDSAKLYDLVHNTPNLVASMLTDSTRIAQGLQKNVGNLGNITFNGTTINLPNVQNPEQFARQMESYMQTVLTESQVFKPRR